MSAWLTHNSIHGVVACRLRGRFKNTCCIHVAWSRRRTQEMHGILGISREQPRQPNSDQKVRLLRIKTLIFQEKSW